MFPYVRFPLHPVSSFKRPVSVPGVSPDSGGQIAVQFAAAWLPYVTGALQQLLLQSTWDTTDPVAIKDIQAQAFDLIALFGNAVPVRAVNSAGQVVGDDNLMLIRQNPTFPNLIESTIDNITWTKFIDLGLLTPIAPQPGVVSNHPASGYCSSYYGVLPGNGKWLAPFLVNTGNDLQMFALDGAVADGEAANWQEPGGDNIVGGAVVAGSSTLVGTDPLPTSPHMSLIALINGVYYPLSNIDFVIPAGVVDAPIVLQVNDSTLSDNFGDFSFQMNFCNN